jgi:hypothetical protein
MTEVTALKESTSLDLRLDLGLKGLILGSQKISELVHRPVQAPHTTCVTPKMTLPFPANQFVQKMPRLVLVSDNLIQIRVRPLSSEFWVKKMHKAVSVLPNCSERLFRMVRDGLICDIPKPLDRFLHRH